MKFIKAALFLSLLSVFSFAQTAPAPTPTPKQDVVVEDDEVIKVDSKLVVVSVSVTDAQGQPVAGLKAPDFRLLEENKLQTIDQVGTAEEVPLEIVVLLDISGSVDPLFEFEQKTAALFLQEVM